MTVERARQWIAMVAIASALLITPFARAETFDDRVITLTDADITATIDGELRPTTPIQLPLHWDVSYPELSGTATLKLAFKRPPNSATAAEPYMIYMIRIANAYAIELNGTLLATAGDLDDIGNRWSSKQPVGISFPAKLLVDDNVLLIQLRGDAARRAGVAAISLGPTRLIEPIRAKAYALRVVMTMACAMLSFLVSGFCFLLWLQQKEKLYAWACIGEAIWAIVVLDVIWESLPLRWTAWTITLVSLRAIWIWALYVIIEQVFGRRPEWERWAMKVMVWCAPISISLAPLVNSLVPFRTWRGLSALLMTGLLIRLLFVKQGRGASERVLLWFGVALLLIAGVHDAVASNLFSSQYGDAVWAKYAGSILGLTFMWIVSKRFRQARAETRQLHASLEQRIEQKELELRDTFARLSAAEKSRAVVAERERILRDMHDGVGANLATAMRQLESGTAPASQVAETLRESLDHLKLSIDAMNLPVGDVNALLASLRYRLQPRIESAGIALEWQVDLLPHWQRGSDLGMRHLQFLLLEAISNALQHADASTLTLSARFLDERIEIELRDNGKGIADQSGRGLRSMRERASAIGAQLTIEPGTPGTRVRLGLPNIEQRATPRE